jgi:hypothetical protein
LGPLIRIWRLGHGSDKPPEKPAQAKADEWDAYGANEPPKPKERPEISRTGAFAAGLTNLFGAGPAIAGLAEASGYPEPDMYESVSPPEQAKRAGLYVARPVIGAMKLLDDWYLQRTGDSKALEAYNRGRQGNLDFNDEAYKQHAPSLYHGNACAGLRSRSLGPLRRAGRRKVRIARMKAPHPLFISRLIDISPHVRGTEQFRVFQFLFREQRMLFVIQFNHILKAGIQPAPVISRGKLSHSLFPLRKRGPEFLPVRD